MHPKKYEDLVGGVFGDLGYQIRVTAYQGTKELTSSSSMATRTTSSACKSSGIVARSKLLRSGSSPAALVLNGMTKGVFVTASSFTKGARGTARAFRKSGLAIQLWDAPTFYDKLRLRRCSPYSGPDRSNRSLSRLGRSVGHAGGVSHGLRNRLIRLWSEAPPNHRMQPSGVPPVDPGVRLLFTTSTPRRVSKWRRRNVVLIPHPRKDF